MSVAYLFGHPVAHSLSPAMHNAAFAALGRSDRYELRDVEPEHLARAVTELRDDGVLGANVTVPHKERIVALLDGVSDDARRIGAVNTVLRDGRTLRGENTDRGGFDAALRESGVEVRGARALVLGAGGAARAVVIALRAAGAEVRIANRTAARAEQLAATLGGTPVPWPRGDVDADLLVNATSLGLHGEDPIDGLPLRSALTVIDLVPTRAETAFLLRAKAGGCRTVDGLLMLLHQAAESFTLWTGVAAPLEAMRAALPRRI